MSRSDTAVTAETFVPLAEFDNVFELVPSAAKDGDMRQMTLGAWLDEHAFSLAALHLEHCGRVDSYEWALVVVCSYEAGRDRWRVWVAAQTLPVTAENFTGRSIGDMLDFIEDDEIPVVMYWPKSGSVDHCTLNNMTRQLRAIYERSEA